MSDVEVRRRHARIASNADRLYKDLLAELEGRVRFEDGEARLDEAFDTLDVLMGLVGVDRDAEA